MVSKPTAARWRNWELWPFWMRYALITPVWGWYMLRARRVWFFSSANPTLTFSGFEGEGKEEMYALLPRGTYPDTVFIEPNVPFPDVLQKLRNSSLQYPFIVKPDVGMKGLLFRKIHSEEALRRYHEGVPFRYLMQALVDYPLEVSLFYYRLPGREEGTISGFVQKDVLSVTGTGRHSLRELILQHPRAAHRTEELSLRHGARFDEVIGEGEVCYLADAANLNRGATFTNLQSSIDARLLEVFDPISRKARWDYGRYDIKCASIESLKSGKDFSILEFNGTGAEPNHVYHAGHNLLAALRIILRHWAALYDISAANRRNGVPSWSYSRGRKFLKAARKHFDRMEKVEKTVMV